MRFLLQGVLALAILFYISVWVASIPTTTGAKTDLSVSPLDWAFAAQANP
jgi:hypothetical protein